MVTILFLQHNIVIKAQDNVTISGIVSDKETNQPLEGVNVMVQNFTKKYVLGFALTDINGHYSINCKHKSDTILVIISGFNIKAQERYISNKSQIVKFTAKSEALKIKEVTIKPNSIERQGDTIVYNINSFSSIADNNIADILKKMPGIVVTPSGEIKYNGLAINKFYIEGIDLLGGRYGVATNNIKYNDISRIEVLENHQPIRVLKDRSFSNRAAINLRLKESAKGIWANSFKLGMGYKPISWNTETTAMHFGHQNQSIHIYKSNNIGYDVSEDIFSHENTESANSLLEIKGLEVPNIDKQRYLYNNIHLLSSNTTILLNNGIELTANADYVHDLQNANSYAITTYYKPYGDSLTISENANATQRTDFSNFTLKIESNKEKSYILNKTSFAGKWKREYGDVFNDTSNLHQNLKFPHISYKNDFQGIIKLGNKSFEISSLTHYKSNPASLLITPMIYPEAFSSSKVMTGTKQDLNVSNFNTNNNISCSFSNKRWNLNIKGGFLFKIETMKSVLHPILKTAESNNNMINNIYWKNISFFIHPGISYIGKKASLYLYFATNFINQHIYDRVLDNRNKYNNIFMHPGLSFQSNLTNNLKLSIHALHSENYGNLYDVYSGYIMSNYRTISRREREIELNRKSIQNYSLSLSYGNAIRSLFSSFNFTYQHSKQDLMFNTIYNGTLSYTEMVRKPNNSYKYNIDYTISKSINNISTTIYSLIGYSYIKNFILRVSEPMQITQKQCSVELESNTRLTQSILFSYKASYVQQWTYSKVSSNLKPIHILQESANINFIFARKFIWNIRGEHYFDRIGKTHNTYFIDTRLTFKQKQSEYSLTINNLLARNKFHSASYSDMTKYIYNFKLRPFTIMFNAKISI